MKNLLVVVDMINGFVNFGALADKKINYIVPNIEKLIKKAIKNGYDIVAFKDCHEKDDVEFKTFPEHCVKGTEESELIPEINKYKKYMHIIEKQTTNGFRTNEFKRLVSQKSYNNVIVCGCCTDICVQNFAESLKDYYNNCDIDTNIIIYDKAVATFDSPEHNAKKCQAQALMEMEKIGIKIKYVKKENSKEEDDEYEKID